MFCPKLLRRAAEYRYLERSPEDIGNTTEDDLRYYDIQYGVKMQLPSVAHFNINNTYTTLNNADLGAFSYACIEADPAMAYCKLGNFSSYTLVGRTDEGIFPQECLAIIGGDFCRINIRLNLYSRYYEVVPCNDGVGTYKKRLSPTVTGLAFKGDTFHLDFDIGRECCYLHLRVLTGDLSVYHQGELVAVCPAGLSFHHGLYKDNKWKWTLRRDCKEHRKKARTVTYGRLS